MPRFFVAVLALLAAQALAQPTAQDAQSAIDEAAEARLEALDLRGLLDSLADRLDAAIAVLQAYRNHHGDPHGEPSDPPGGGVPPGGETTGHPLADPPLPGPFHSQTACAVPAWWPNPQGYPLHAFVWCDLPGLREYDPLDQGTVHGHGLQRGFDVTPQAPGQLRLVLHAGGQYPAPKVYHHPERSDVVIAAPQLDVPGCRDWGVQTNCDGTGWRDAAGNRIRAALDSAVAWYGPASEGGMVDLEQGIEIAYYTGPAQSLGSSAAFGVLTPRGIPGGWERWVASVITGTGWTWTPGLAQLYGGGWSEYDQLQHNPGPVYVQLVAGLLDNTTKHDPRICAWMDQHRMPGVCIQYQGGHGVPADAWPQYQRVRLDRPVIAWLDSTGDTPCTNAAGTGIPCARRDGFHVDTLGIVEAAGQTTIPVRYTQRTGRSAGVPDLPPSVTVTATIWRLAEPGTLVSWAYGVQAGAATVDAEGALAVPLEMQTSAAHSPLALTH